MKNDSENEFNVTASVAQGTKCIRCWKVLIEVGQWRQHPYLCLRCVDAVLYHDTGEGLYEHAIKNFDSAYCKAIKQGSSAYCKAIKQGSSKEEAENIAGKWNNHG